MRIETEKTLLRALCGFSSKLAKWFSRSEKLPGTFGLQPIVFQKRGIELTFGWIFSIIVGAVIIFLAIYGAMRFVNTERTIQDSESALLIQTRLASYETGLETASRPENISFASQTRITNECDTRGVYGVQKISIATRSDIGETWQEAGVAAKSNSLYVFSQSSMESNQLYSVVKPLNMPFKIGNIVVLWSEPQCFVNPPAIVEEEIEELGLSQSGIEVKSSASSCKRTARVICFGPSGGKECDAVVDTGQKKVTQGKSVVYYEEPLLYAAAIASPELYECQVKRMLKRGAELAELYEGKSALVAARSVQGCSSSLQSGLQGYSSLAKNASSRDLDRIYGMALELERENKATVCPLWKEGLA